MKTHNFNSLLIACLLSLAIILPAELSADQSQEAKKRFENDKVLAEKGNAYAQHNLGLCYHNGEGVPKDYVQAVFWHRKAAEQGLAQSQNSLGVLL